MSAPKKKSWAGKLVNSFLGKQKSDRSIGDKNRTSIPHRNLPARSDSEANFQRSTAVPKSSRAVSNVSRRRRNYSDRVKEADQEQAQDCSLESDNTVTNDKITYSSSRSNSEKTDKIMTDELYHSSLSPRPQFSPKKKSTTTTAIKGQNDMKQSEGPGTFETEAPTEEASSNDTSFRNSSTTASDDRVNILTTNTAPTGTHPLEFSQVNTFLLRPVNQSGDDDGSERDPGLTDSRRAATLFEGKESGRSNEFDALSDSSGSIDLVAVANNVTTPLDRPPIEESGSSIQVCSVRLKGSSPASDAGETNQESNSSAVDVCKARDIYPATNSWRLSSSCEESDVSIMSSPLSHSDEESQSDRDPLQLEDFSSTDICPPASKDQRSAGTRDDIGGDSSNVSVSVVDNSEGSATAIPSDTVVDDKTHEDTTPLARHVDSNVSKDDSRDVPTAYSDTDTSPPASKNQHSAGTIGDIGGDSSNVSVSFVTSIPSDTVVDDKTHEDTTPLARHVASNVSKDDSRDVPTAYSDTDTSPPASKNQHSAGTIGDIGGDSSNVSVSFVTSIPSDTVVDDKTHEDTTPLARHVASNVSKDDSRDVPTAYSDTDTSPPASKNQHSAGTIGDIGGDSSNVSVSFVTSIPSDTVVDDKTHEDTTPLARHVDSNVSKDDSRDVPTAYSDTDTSPPASKNQHSAGTIGDIGGDSSNVSVSVVDTSEGSATAIPSDTVVDDKTYEVSVFLAKHNASKGLKDDSRDIPFSYTDTSFSTQHRAGATCDIDDAQSSPEVLDELHDLQSSSGSELSSIFNHVVDSQNKSIILPHKVTNDDGTAPFTNCDEEIENYFRLGGLVATKASFTRRRECTTSQAKTSEAASLVDKGSNSMHRSRRHHLGADIGRGNTLCAVTTTMARLEHADPISLYFYLGSVYAGVGVKHTIDASKGDCPMLLDVEE